MNRRIKDIIFGILLTLCLTSIFNFGISTQASPDLQSTGRIVLNNPNTGLEEVVFDADDQAKLKDSITANSLNITELEEDINELNNNLGGVKFGIDGDGNYGYYGADDSLIPFNSDVKLKLVIKWYAITGGITDVIWGCESSTQTSTYYIYQNKMYSNSACTSRVTSLSLTKTNIEPSRKPCVVSYISSESHGKYLNTGIKITSISISVVE